MTRPLDKEINFSCNIKLQEISSRKMSTTLASSAETIFNLGLKPSQSFKKLPNPENLSFSSQVTKSRISIGNPSGPSGRGRPTARVVAFYAPRETVETLYQVLGIPETGTSLSDIKKAYKKMARKYHPDVSSPDRVDEYTRRFIMVHQAYETLSNPQRRASYDRDLAGGLGAAFSAGKPHQYHQGMEEREEWKARWQSQLERLRRRRDVKRDSQGTTSSWARPKAHL